VEEDERGAKMDSEEIKANEKRFFEFVNQRDTKAIEKWIDECVAEDFINHSPAFDEPTDREGLKEMLRKLFELVPSLTMTIEKMVFENDFLCFRYIMRGFGTKDETMGMAMVRFKDGKIVERWNLAET
jgi:predicted SnoaL-like aldol condensation-catalyzing enzyme